ncbi:MAG: hypothetical protein HZA61_14020 [Candidatus Eisenbacteria bacterium]|uniref:6-bladed beta-propeller n=1 Tax=Eiseniibacteriota bacterium TaxID=2212470 RepID=A0A933SFX7_UNCEI|nr:hypothetical protein [Candidatus Eisenbacteria bacterium]
MPTIPIPGRSRPIFAVARAWLAAAALVLAARASFAGAPPAAPVWPPPPDRARVAFVESWSSPRDFARGLFKRLSNFASGAASSEAMVKPTGIAVSADGQRVWVLDAARIAIFAFDRTAHRARVLSLSGLPVGPLAPFGLASDAADTLYVTDQSSHSVVVLSPEGRLLRAFGRDSLARPVGCAVDAKRGLLYVVDTPAGREAAHRVGVFTLGGTFVRWLGSRGLENGQFNYPTYVTVSPEGEVHVVDTLNWRIQVFDAEGKFLRAFGRHGDARGDFDRPKGVAIDRFSNLYVADGSWDRVLIFDRSGRALLDFGGRGTWPGGLQEPTAVAVGPDDRIYVADTNGHRLNVYRLLETAADSTGGAGRH